MKTLLSIYQANQPKQVKTAKTYLKSEVVTKHKSRLTNQASSTKAPRVIDVTKLESNYDLDKYTTYLD